MWTGRQTLGSIEKAIANLRGEEGQQDAALRSATSEAERLRREQAQAYKELARVKLDAMTAGQLASNLDAGERRAMQILDEHRLRMTSTVDRRTLLQKEVAAAEAERHAAGEVVEQALTAVESLRAQAETEAQATDEWRAAKSAHDDAEAIAAEAEKKASSSESELGAKKKPYDEDPLFVYLWRRNFGRADYRAGNVARSIDRVVADFIGFSDARPNYAALIEIPLRLREHASAKRAAADASKGAMAEIERRTMLGLGIDARERQLSEARHKLAAADDMAEKKRSLLAQVDAEHAGLIADGSSAAYDGALTTIAEADSKDDLAVLYNEARRTMSSADDAIVRKIETTKGSIAKVDEEIAGLRRTAQDLARRRVEVEQVRDRFRGAGFDHPYATFENDGDIANILKRVLGGAVRSGILWDILRQGYGNRAPRGRPDFGAPQFPFPFPIPGGGGQTRGSSGGGWREPSSRGSWSPAPSDRGGSDDDNFTTGGSF